MKKTLAILLALVLCLSAFALIACNDCKHEFKDGVCTKCGEKDPDYKGPQGGGNTDVPVVEGKITLYLTVADGSVTIPEYGAIYFIGGSTGWDPATNSIAMTRLNDTNTYYVQIAYDATVTQADEYKVGLGYSAASGLPASKYGISWTLVSDECPKDTNNLKFVVADGAQKVNLGAHTFTTALSAPVTLDALQLRVTFSAALGANAEVYIMGDFNGWNADNAKATANADRTVYSLDLTEVLCTNYSYKILVYKDGANADTLVLKDGEDKDIGIWDRYVAEPDWTGHAATDKLIGYTVISAGTDNLPLEVTEFDGEEGYIDLAGSVSEAFADQPVVGIDLSKAILLEGEDTVDGEKVGNGKFTWTYSSLGKKTFKVTFTEALDENVIVFIPGGMNGWDGSGASDKMTIAADRKSATWTMDVAPGTYEYKLVFFHKDVFNDNVWDDARKEVGVSNDDGSTGNASIKVEGFDDGDVILFADPITAPAVTQPSTEPVVTLDKVTFKVTFSGDMTGKHVYLVGTPTGWTFTEMTAGANGVYTLEVSNVEAKEHKYKVVVGDTVLAGWDDPRTGEYGGTDGTGSADAAVTVAANATTVELFGGASLTAPAAAE